MAVTRINNNQITTAVSGNAYLGINAAAKLQNYSITSNKIANSLVYGSDLTISGNLTVNGTTTTVDTINTLIQDPILVLADGQTAGVPSVDIGILGYRGAQNSSFLGWKEDQSTFMAILSNTTVSNTTVNVTSYANFTASTITAQANLSVIGNIVGNANFSGNLAAGNILTPGLISSTGNVTGGNILTGGQMSASGDIAGNNLYGQGAVSTVGNITGGNVLTGGIVSATGNVRGANINTAGEVSAVGNIYGGNVSTAGNVTAAYFIGNIQGNIDAAGSNTQIQFNTTGDILGANANFTYNYATNVMTVNGGNISAGNISTSGSGGAISGTGNITGGNLLTTGLVSATGNATAGNVNTVGLITATGNITGGNILTGGLVSSAGNITSATNVNTPNVVATGNLTLTGGNILLTPTSNVVVNNTYINGVAQPVQNNDVATKIYVDNAVSTQIAYHQAVNVATTTTLASTTGGTITYTQPNGAGNGVGALLTTTGAFNLIDTANVQTVGTRILVKNEANAAFNGIYTWANATNIVRSTDADQYGPNSSEELSINDYFFVTSGNVNKGSAYVVDAPSGTITFGTSNISFAQFSSSQTYTAGNGISLYGTVISTVYDNSTIGVNGSNQLYIPANAPLVTPNIGAATGTSLSVTGAVTAGTDLSAVANVIAGNVSTTGLVTATGNITGGNVLTAGLISSTGNVTSGNVLTGGIVSATGNAIVGNVNTAGLITATGNITGGNLLTAGLISATSNITGGNILYGAGIVSGTGNIYGANLIVSNIESVAGNITGGNILTGGLISATSNITGGNILTGGIVSATGNATVGNLVTAGLISATGTGTFGNIQIGPDSINDIGTNQTITINSTNANTNFAVSGGLSNVFFVNASTNSASFGSNVQTASSIVAFNSSDSILLPVGNTGVRPSGVTGQFRFNTTLNSLEIYDNSAWTPVGSTIFTVIADEQFNGDGANVNFTLGSTQTTNSCIVSINGIVQVPGSAYSVAGTYPTCVLTFTEAPSIGDLIDVREITTTTTVVSISNSSGNSVLAGSATRAEMTLTGNLIPIGANATQSLGNSTNAWSSLYVAGNTIYLGNLQLQQGAANSFVVYQADGTTPAPLALGNSTISTTGAVTAGSLNVGTGSVTLGNILNGNGNGVGNIGNSTTYFNTVFAKATSAQYADLAEKYVADAEYAPGTVVSFGGEKEVTKSAKDGDRAVAGVVSTNPSYIMNATLDAEHVAVVAFTGRVPTSVTGTVTKGDLMVSNGDGTARAEADPKAGAIIGKALENFAGGTGVIEVVIGRF